MRPFSEEKINKSQYQHLLNIEKIQLFQEESSSSKERVELNKLLKLIKSGDELYVYNLYVLADSTRNLLDLLHTLKSQNVLVHFLANRIDTSDTSTFSFLYILEELAQFQSEVISEKTKIGLYKAQKKGNNAGRPKKSMLSINKAIEMFHSKKFSFDEIKEETGISKSTLYRNLEN